MSKGITTNSLRQRLTQLHEDEAGVAMTEYLIVFSAVTIGTTAAIFSVAAYIKAYRDFMIWWLAHPAT